jgi:nicotinamide-nucleotide amidase
MFTQEIRQAAETLIQRCLDRKLRLVVAESCTGGLITAAITAIPGASRVVDRGFVCYSYEAKEQDLGVPKALTDEFGAVSQPVAAAMATGALQRTGGHSQVSLAVTGVAGPEASDDKPAGLVHLAVARSATATVRCAKCEFGAIGRDAVREQTVLAALRFALECLEQ